MPRGLVFCVVLALLGAARISGQQPAGQDVLARARDLYRRGAYDSTVQLVRGFLTQRGKEAVTEHLVPVLSEALVRTGDLDYVPRLLAIYEKKFASSPYLPRMYYLAGIVTCRAGRAGDGVVLFSRALRGGVGPELDTLIRQNVLLACDKALSPAEMAGLLRREELDGRVQELVAYSLVRAYAARRQVAKAERAARDFAERFPQSLYADAVRQIVAARAEERSDHVVVGVLAPLSGYDADIGRRILQGAQLAVDEHNAAARPPVRLVVGDTRSSGVETAHRALEMINDQGVQVLIGPVLSQEAAVVAAMLVERDQVMITPTATEDGLAELGPNIFQMNVTTGMLGRTMAEYAVKNLNISEFALMTPISEYGRVLAESFKAEVRRLGGEIVAEEFFDEGANDYRKQFLSLRRTLFSRRKMRDSLDAVAAGRPAAPRTWRQDSLCLADSALTIGGLFIPAVSEDVVMIAPQVHFFKLQTQMLGATGWHTAKTILDGKKYVENAVFVTSAETERTDSLWLAFRTRYHGRFGLEPDRVSALGYDAGALVCRTLAGLGGSFSGGRFAAALRSVQGYRGVSGLISFDAGRNVNREAVIMKISDKRFIRVR